MGLAGLVRVDPDWRGAPAFILRWSRTVWCSVLLCRAWKAEGSAVRGLLAVVPRGPDEGGGGTCAGRRRGAGD